MISAVEKNKAGKGNQVCWGKCGVWEGPMEKVTFEKAQKEVRE